VKQQDCELSQMFNHQAAATPPNSS